MFLFLARFYRRIQAIRHIQLNGKNALFLFHKDVEIQIEPGSEIIVSEGIVKIGYPLPKTSSYASFSRSFIYLGRNSKIIFDGHTFIAPGATIRVKDGATLIFKGHHHIAHNFTLICSKTVEIGEFSAISWGVTLIDDDGHRFETKNGKLIKGFYKPLVLKRNVGLQMNVQIPRGVTIGENSVISCGAVVRCDVPDNSLAYNEMALRVKEGITCPKPIEIDAS